MRTTIRLDEQLLTAAKELAVRSRRTLTAVIEDALREAIARARGPAARSRVRLPTYRGRGLRPGVDLDAGADLRDLMDAAR
jgi:hypothetical protein